jgi:hypothetical protein
MRKSEIETYMNAFMDGFWQCYDMMMDMMDDDEAVNNFNEIKRMVSEIQPIVPNMAKPKEEPEVETSANSSKPKPRTGTNVPEPRNVPHAPEKPTKTPMPEVKPTHDKFVELFKEGKLPTEVAKELGVSPATAYNHLTKAKDKGEL